MAKGLHRPLSAIVSSVVVQDRAVSTIFGELGIAAVAEQIERKRLVRLLLAVAVDDNRARKPSAGVVPGR